MVGLGHQTPILCGNHYVRRTGLKLFPYKVGVKNPPIEGRQNQILDFEDHRMKLEGGQVQRMEWLEDLRRGKGGHLHQGLTYQDLFHLVVEV